MKNMSEISDLIKISKHENTLFEILFAGSLAILYGLMFYFLTIDMTGFIILEILASPFILVGIFNIVLKEKTLLKKTRKDPKIFFDVLGNEKMIFRFPNMIHYRRYSFRIFIFAFVIFGSILLAIEYDILNSEQNKDETIIILIGMMLLPGSVAYGFHVVKTGFTYSLFFDYYFCKACFQVLSDDKKIVEIFQLRLAVEGLKSYNNYLNSKIGRHIKKLDNVILTILGDSKDNMNNYLKEINQRLDSPDSLELLRYLTNSAEKSNIDFTDTKEIEKIKEIIPIILPPIGLIVTIIQYSINQIPK